MSAIQGAPHPASRKGPRHVSRFPSRPNHSRSSVSWRFPRVNESQWKSRRPDRGTLDRFHSRRRTPRRAAEPVHAVAVGEHADHGHRHGGARGRARRRRVLVAGRAAARPARRRRGDGTARRAGAAARVAADDLEPRAVRRLRRDDPDRARVPDVHRLFRQRLGARRAGRRATAARRRRGRHPAVRGRDRRADGVRLSRDPLRRPDRERGRHHRVRVHVRAAVREP